jgi:hypothetical protein
VQYTTLLEQGGGRVQSIADGSADTDDQFLNNLFGEKTNESQDSSGLQYNNSRSRPSRSGVESSSLGADQNSAEGRRFFTRPKGHVFESLSGEDGFLAEVVSIARKFLSEEIDQGTAEAGMTVALEGWSRNS